MEPAIEDRANAIRIANKKQEQEIRALMDAPEFSDEEAYPGQHSEMKANIMLAVRRQEDVRMRLGKLIQAADDGVSCYDKG